MGLSLEEQLAAERARNLKLRVCLEAIAAEVRESLGNVPDGESNCRWCERIETLLEGLEVKTS